MWPIMPTSFPPTPWVKNRGLNVWKTSCDSSTHFVYFNSWQLVDGLTSVMKHGHHSWAYSESLTKFWGSSVYSSPPYSTYCTLKIHTLDPKPLLHPIEDQETWSPPMLYAAIARNSNSRHSFSHLAPNAQASGSESSGIHRTLSPISKWCQNIFDPCIP